MTAPAPSAPEPIFSGVRAKDIKPGQEYTLKRAGRRTFRVTAMPTPPEVSEQGRVLVRFEEGVLRGQVTEQLPRFLVAPADSTPATNSTRARPAPRILSLPGVWPPNVGDPVMWPKRTGPLRWRVVRVNADVGEATIAGRVLEMDQEHTVRLVDLESVPLMVESKATATQPTPRSRRRNRVRKPLPPEARDEGSPLERAIERLEFSVACLQQYQREFEPRVPWAEIGKRLRRELRNRGRLVRRSDEYLRIRTRRLDVVVCERPSDEKPCVVEELFPLGKSKRGGPRRRRSDRSRR